MKKVRLSYSLLTSWDRGDPDRVVAQYFHVDMPTTQAMDYGLKFHEDMERAVKENGQIPGHVFTGGLDYPETEVKKIVEYNEMFDLSAVFDVLDGDTIYDYKTGKQPSNTHAGKLQMPFYFLVSELAGLDIEKGILIHYNQHTDTKDWSLVWNTPDKVEHAKNWIDSYGPEIHNFFKTSGLI